MRYPIAGIDYGNGQTNIDLQTGIRYGVISMRSVSDEWLNEFEAHYDFDGIAEEDHDFVEPHTYTYNKDGIEAQYSPDSSWVWVFKSPVIVECKFCSPCVPGAGDLDNQVMGGIKTYGLPKDCLYTEY